MPSRGPPSLSLTRYCHPTGSRNCTGQLCSDSLLRKLYHVKAVRLSEMLHLPDTIWTALCCNRSIGVGNSAGTLLLSIWENILIIQRGRNQHQSHSQSQTCEGQSASLLHIHLESFYPAILTPAYCTVAQVLPRHSASTVPARSNDNIVP